MFPLDPCLFQLRISQVLNSSLLASPQARWAPLSFLPDIFTLLFFMINPLMINISFPWVIINFIYLYAPTVTRMYPSNSFMDESAIDSILPISMYLSLHSGQLFNVGSFKPSFQQCQKNAHPQCASSCSRACSSHSLLCTCSSNLRFSSSYFCFW
jgi:hypothetical protein